MKRDLQTQARKVTAGLDATLLLQCLPEVVLVLNGDRQIITASRAAVESPGVGAPCLLGLRPGSMLGCVHACDGACGTAEPCRMCGIEQAVTSALRGRMLARECRVRCGGGDALDLRAWAAPADVRGERFALLTLRDIGVEKRKEAMDRIFFHDAMSTVGNLRGLADLLGTAGPDRDDELRGIIPRLGRQLAEEVGALRDLGAAEERMLFATPETLSSLDLVEEIAALYRERPGRETRPVLVEPGAADVTLATDRRLLSRVLGNMVRNAIEASAPDQAVTIGCRRQGDRVEFRVHNPGFMPREVQLQVFQRSFSTRGRGRGLGTYAMKLLSERCLGGSVSFTTSQQGGTTFVASYPLEPGAGC